MKLARFDRFCERLPGATLAIQWRGSHVYKVGEKMFASGNDRNGAVSPYYVFKTKPASFEMLLEQGVASPAPYLPRGHWVRIGDPDVLSEHDLTLYLAQSYRSCWKAFRGPNGRASTRADRRRSGRAAPREASQSDPAGRRVAPDALIAVPHPTAR